MPILEVHERDGTKHEIKVDRNRYLTDSCSFGEWLIVKGITHDEGIAIPKERVAFVSLGRGSTKRPDA